MRRHYLLHLVSVTVCWCGLAASLPAAEPKLSDLDELLRHLSVGGFVNNARLYRPTEETRLAAFEALRPSLDPAVAKTVVALQPALDRMHQAQEIEQQVKKINAELQRKYGPSLFEILGCFEDSMYNASPARLEGFVRSGQLSAGEAEQIRRDGQEFRGDVAGRFFGVLAATSANSARAQRQILILRNRAEVLVSDAGASSLPAALRGRAGAALISPRLEVGLGTARHRGVGGGQGFLTIVSLDERILTRMTVAIRIETKSGSRTGVIYIPNLPVGARFRSFAIPLEAAFLHDMPEAWEPNPTIERSTCSIWCDQFHSEDLVPTPLTSDELFWRLRLDAAAPGAVFVSGQAILSQEKWGRFELRFVKLEPGPKNARIELKLVDNDRKPPSAKTLHGVLEIPPEPEKPKPRDLKAEAKMDLPTLMKARSKAGQEFLKSLSQPGPKGDLVARLRSGSDTIEIGLSFSADSDSSWHAFGGPVDQVFFHAASSLPARGSAEWIAREHYSTAFKAAMRGDFDEGEKVLRQIAVDNPDSEWKEKVEDALERMARMKQDRAERDAAQEKAKARAAEEAPRQLLTQAQILASQEQFDAARKVYEQLRKEYRGTPWEEKAEAGLKGLVTAKKDAEKRALDEKRKPRLNKTKPKSR